jgi:hypothetical protein
MISYCSNSARNISLVGDPLLYFPPSGEKGTMLKCNSSNYLSIIAPLWEMPRSGRGVSHAEQNYIRQVLPISKPPLIQPKGGKILSL